ncbi:MAG: P-type conjugative transfer protein TrbL, partial [Acidobacteriia bacterium]|nr:P-type conjugative transfer protein TrbL [Terriglobia bacterium]
RKIMWIGAFYALLLNGRIWIPAIIDSFERIGQTSSGFNGISPSSVFAQGINIAGALMDGASTSAFFTNTGACLSVMLAAALIVLAFTGITIQFVVAMVESYIVVAAGFVFLGFGGSRWTAPYTERYIGLAVSVGVKIMMIYLLIGTGMDVALTWVDDAQKVAASPSPAMGAFGIMGSALIFLMLCWQIPKLFAAVLGGSPALTGGDLIATGTTLVAGAATVASLGAGAVAAAAGGAAAGSGAAAGGGGAAGGGASSSVAGVGAAGRAGGGSVPPPSSPPAPSSNGGPKQPSPPSGGSSNGSIPVSGGNGTTNGGGGYQSPSSSPPSSGSNGTTHSSTSPVRSSLSSVGGDSLAGSGFEGERTASGFAPSSIPVGTRSASRARVGAVPSNGRPDAAADQAAISSESSGSGSEIPSGGSPVSDVQSVGPASTGNPRSTPGERFASGARRTQRTFSSAADHLRGVRRQWGGLPNDAAPHTPPPRMPIDHGE